MYSVKTQASRGVFVLFCFGAVFLSFIHAVFGLQELETLDNGKPYAVAYTVDLPMVVKCLR